MASINYNDKRFSDVKNQETAAINETKNTYNEMINSTDSYYQQQIDASKQWADKQTEIQNANTDFAIEKVEQAKDKANRDYTKEQKGAYADYQKATGKYGVNAEKLADQGLHQSGYSKSLEINAYNTYQNRYMAARESYNQAILNYDNSIKEAQLANNAALAQIAYEALQKQLELSLQGFQYKNTLVLQKLDAVNKEKDRYYQRWRDVESQINTENAMAEQIRQFNANLAFQKQKAAQEQANWEKEFALAKSKANGSGGGSGGSSGGKVSKGGTVTIKEPESKVSNTSKTTSNTNTKESILDPKTNRTFRIALTLQNSGGLSAVQKKQNIARFLKSELENGAIDKSGVKLITKKLGY